MTEKGIKDKKNREKREKYRQRLDNMTEEEREVEKARWRRKARRYRRKLGIKKRKKISRKVAGEEYCKKIMSDLAFQNKYFIYD